MNSGLFKGDPVRYEVLDYTKSQVFLRLIPFIWYYDHEGTKQSVIMFLGSGNTHAARPDPKLGSKPVRH